MQEEDKKERIKKEIEDINEKLKTIKESHTMLNITFEERLRNYDAILEQDHWTKEEREILEEQRFNLAKMRDSEEFKYTEYEFVFKKDMADREELLLEIDEEKEIDKENENNKEEY